MEQDNHKAFRKKITNSQIIGSKGEMFVGFLLSHFCLVRPVANGTDVGIDLYCESLIDGMPHTHFWVQVKAQEKKLAKSKTFELRDLEYWSRQPIPVFIFLVSGEKMDKKNFQINVINLTEKFIAEPSINPKTTARKKLNCDQTISSYQDLQKFIYFQIPNTIARLFVREGVIFPIRHTVDDQYLKHYDNKGLHKYARVIMKNIGRTSALLMRDILKNDSVELTDKRKQLEAILETYSDWGNYDFHYSLGLSKLKDREYSVAINCFENALKIINADHRAKASMEWTITRIRARIEWCRTKMVKSQ